MAVININAYDEFVDFIMSSPTLEQLTEFRLSETTQQRISELLEINRESRLTAEQEAELDEYLRLEHLMSKLKLRAFEKLDHS